MLVKGLIQVIALMTLAQVQAPAFADYGKILPLVSRTDHISSAEWGRDVLGLIDKNFAIFSLLDSTVSSAKLLFVTDDVRFQPAFDLKDFSLTLGPITACPSGKLPDHVGTDLHEYAHSIFTANLYKTFSLDREPTTKEGYSFAHAVLRDPEIELSKLVTIRDLSAPFDELFADTFAVLALENPQAISAPLSICGGESYQGYRDFSGRYPVEGWSHGYLKPQSLLTGANAHDILAPARPIIWNTYLELRAKGFANAKAIVIKRLYDASAKIIKNLTEAKTTYRQWFDTDKPALNRVLIEEFGRY